VIGAARAGDDTAISDIFENGCSEYRDTRVAPPGGVTIDKPLPAPAPAAGELCADLPADVPCDPGFGPDRVIDTGPTEFARGETGLDSRGVPIVYLVAPGDSWFAVADRFQLGARLWPLNCYRFAGPELYVGDIVNLSAYRVATVGVNNGSSDGGPARDDCLRQTGLPPQV
jgi:hypothetical protein